MRPDFEPTDPNAYDWGEYEPLMAAAKERGWPVLLTISGPVPKWATQSKLDNRTRPSPSAFAAFVTAVGRKFGDQVNAWSIWNEPNQPQFLLPQFADGGRAVSPEIYRNLYLAGVRGLRKAGQGNDTILLGETSPRGNSNVVAPLRFLRGMLCLDAKYHKRASCSALPASGYAHHAYTTRQGPSFKPPNPDDVTIGVLSRLTSALDRAEAGRRADEATADLPDRVRHPVDAGHAGRRLARQAGAVPRDLRAHRLGQPARRRVLAVPACATAIRPGPSSTAASNRACASPMAGRSPRWPPSRLPLAVERQGSKVSIWGLVRPTTGVTSATVTYADRGSSAFKKLRTVTTNALGYFQVSSTWRKGRRWNLTWQGRSGSPVSPTTSPEAGPQRSGYGGRPVSMMFCVPATCMYAA